MPIHLAPKILNLLVRGPRTKRMSHSLSKHTSETDCQRALAPRMTIETISNLALCAIFLWRSPSSPRNNDKLGAKWISI